MTDDSETAIVWRLPEHAAEVVGLFAFPHGADSSDELFWRTHDDGSIQIGAMCSDFFAYACADVEMIDPEDMPLLRQTFADLKAIDETMWLGYLFAARKRRVRPVGAWGQNEHTCEALRDLFDQAPSYRLDSGSGTPAHEDALDVAIDDHMQAELGALTETPRGLDTGS